MPPCLFISSWRTLTNVWCSTMRLFMISASVPWNLPLPPVSPSSFSRNPYSHILAILFIHWMWCVWSFLRQITVCASVNFFLSLLFTKPQSFHPLLVCTHDYQLELVSCQKLKVRGTSPGSFVGLTCVNLIFEAQYVHDWDFWIAWLSHITKVNLFLFWCPLVVYNTMCKLVAYVS